ncbi:MAG: PaaI family thioesterase [Telmatospirillum sp.]|nr:PaaI family thioesterase [Telmatospirillum sp.]
MVQDDRLLEGEEPSGFQKLLGYRLVEWQEGRAVLELASEAIHTNRAGLVHGGVLTTLIDTACGFSATWCPFPGRVRRVLTLSLTTTFTGQARGGVLRATGLRRGGGRKIITCSGEILDAAGNLIAIGEGTYRYHGGSEHPEGVPLP